MAKRINKLLTTTIAKNEFSQTFITKHLDEITDQQEEEKEQCNDISNERISFENNQIQSSAPKIAIKNPSKPSFGMGN